MRVRPYCRLPERAKSNMVLTWKTIADGGGSSTGQYPSARLCWSLVLLSECRFCGGWPIIGFLKGLTEQESGVIVVATMMLFPTTLTLFGGIKLYFAAKEAYEMRKRARLKKEKEARERVRAAARAEGLAEGRAAGRAEGRAAGRKQIRVELEKRGMLTPELAKVIDEQPMSSE